jgi:hypothetical protein
MLELSITTNIPEKVGKLALLTDLQFRYAVAQAMTDSAKAGQKAITDSMSRYIDRPTPFTQRSTYVSFANPNRLRAEVGFKGAFPTSSGTGYFAGGGARGGSGTPAGKYLSAMARGGDREPKRGERMLRARGLIRGSQYIVPNRKGGWPGDPYGNVPRGTYTLMYSQLKAFSESGFGANDNGSARSRSKRETVGGFFMSRSGRAILYRPPGGDSRDVETAFMVLDDAPNHERRFPIVRILNEEVQREYPRLIKSSLEAELRRAGFG